MPTARATRTIPAASAAVWRVAADPLTLPRWWPRVVRVEGARGKAFTEVRQTDRGRQVRADFRVTVEEQGRRRVWEQEVVGTPFERVFASSETEVRLKPSGMAETEVELELRQRLRGVSRLGAPLAARAARRILREALAALEREVAAGA